MTDKKTSKTKKKEIKEEKVEKTYVIPLREKCRPVPRYKKANKAVKTIKEFIVRHMKIRDRDLKKVRIDKYLNEAIWSRGIRKPPIKIKVKAIQEGDIVRVELAEMSKKLSDKKARAERDKLKSAEVAEKKKKVVEKPKEEKLEDKIEDKKEGEEKKKEEKEKVQAGAEATQKMEKAAARQAKHKVGGKTKQPKRPVRQAMAK